MYILIEIGTNGRKCNKLVSESKKKLEDYIKEKGYYYSKEWQRYIDDKTSKIDGGSGSGIDYYIDKINKI